MDFALGGKIDTELYSAAIGALSSTANAGQGAATIVHPATAIAHRQNARILPDLPNRFRPLFGSIARFTLKKTLR